VPCLELVGWSIALATGLVLGAGDDTSIRRAVDQHSATCSSAPASTTTHQHRTWATPPATSTSSATTAASSAIASSSSSNSRSSTSTSSIHRQGPDAAGSTGGTAAAGGRQRVCGQCGAEGAAMRCGGCDAARYCNPTCQKAHWKVHKRQCKELQRQRAGSQGGAAGSITAAAAVPGGDGA
jgi:hypothetical protein